MGSIRRRVTSAGLLAIGFCACNGYDLEAVTTTPGPLGVNLGRVAVVTSDYDRVEELLHQWEVPYTLFDGFVEGPAIDALLTDAYHDLTPVEALLSNEDALAYYRVLFINCGARGTGTVDPDTLEPTEDLLTDPTVARRLASFVKNGGHLVVSDQSYTLLEAAFPDLINFYGEDAVWGAAEVGQAGSVTGTVVNASLQTALNASQLTVSFPLSRWAVPVTASGIWVSATVPATDETGSSIEVVNAPLVVQQQAGSGTLTFTAFHNLPVVEETWADFQAYLLISLAED